MNLGLTHISQNLSLQIETIIIIIFLIGGIIFFAKDFKIGVVMYFLGSGGLFMLFYQLGWNFAIPTIVFFMSLIILSLTLYASAKKVETGGVT